MMSALQTCQCPCLQNIPVKNSKQPVTQAHTQQTGCKKYLDTRGSSTVLQNSWYFYNRRPFILGSQPSFLYSCLAITAPMLRKLNTHFHANFLPRAQMFGNQGHDTLKSTPPPWSKTNTIADIDCWLVNIIYLDHLHVQYLKCCLQWCISNKK